ncbi:hypothetical protein F9C07_4156 [Aspergillus flavus]|uniref:Uncharacterized protein n=1 Tax=Aspergillus flavus (strain ATCC 200026 / FGSC A1120 / IAM 13836 / NRRL 3357 / JCM 12722 / SRRC 167) TaxID=332952 RepID=A0A7U2MJY6_ASPFN|nr:hypothetical protein F9C07_4156 [Aspergillus flavus]
MRLRYVSLYAWIILSLTTPRLEDIGGLIIAGLALATTTGHMIRAGKVRAEIAAKTKEKAQLESDLELVRRSRQAVEQVGLTDLATFKTVIRAIPAAATASSVDATEVKSWLENGAKEEVRIVAFFDFSFPRLTLIGPASVYGPEPEKGSEEL